ncbi:MAG: ice-binding family protein [Jatrophihabitantaceae bacterium]
MPSAAGAAEAPVGLGTAASYSVLGGQAVTNTGPSVLGGDLGVSPGTAITGFPPGLVNGATHAADAAAGQAQSDVVTAYNDTASRAPTASVAGDLVGRTLTAGVYNSTGPLAVSGMVTLNGQGNPNSVFIFQVASTLITASASNVSTINGAQACHIYWQVASSATLGTASTFQGTILALTSISVTTSTTVKGRALARNGQVSLDTNVFTSAACAVTVPSSTPASSPRVTATPTHTAPAGVPATGTGARPASSSSSSAGSNGSAPGTGFLAATGRTPIPQAVGLASLLLLLGISVLALSRRRARAMRRPGSPSSR